MRGLFRRGISVSEADVIQVPKRGGGIRPVALLPLATRVLYRALTDQLLSEDEPVDRSFTRKQSAQTELLDIAGVTHIVTADVASFYDYVDHQLLETELVTQTGSADFAEHLSSMLGTVMGRSFGLPQVYESSDALSEVYIDIVERAVLRNGFEASRYNDDFWIATSSWRQGHRAVETLTREARSVGLSLNERKTVIHPLDQFREYVQEPDRRLDETVGQISEELRTVSIAGYGEHIEIIEPDDEEVFVASCERVLETILNSEEEIDRLQDDINRQVMSTALSALGFFDSTKGLPFCDRVLAREPFMARDVCHYMAGIGGQVPDEVVVSVEAIISNKAVALSTWESLWLVDVVRRLSMTSPDVIKWARSLLEPTTPSFVRARAALALAEVEEITRGDIEDLYPRADDASLPDLVYAASRILGADDPIVRSAAKQNPLLKWVVESAAAQ